MNNNNKYDQEFMKENVDKILEKTNDNLGELFLGGVSAAENINFLKENKILAVLTILLERDVSFDKSNLYIDHLVFKVFDEGNVTLYPYFNEAYNFIDNHLKKGESVLVHCFGGITRSATIVISYIMLKNKLKYAEAFDLVKEKRKIIRISNRNFVNDLLKLEKDIFI